MRIRGPRRGAVNLPYNDSEGGAGKECGDVAHTWGKWFFDGGTRDENDLQKVRRGWWVRKGADIRGEFFLHTGNIDGYRGLMFSRRERG